MSDESALSSGPGLASLTLLPLLFLLDRSLPVGVSVGVLYIIPVLLTQWAGLSVTAVVSALSSALIVADASLSSGTVTWTVLLNHGFSLLSVWLTAALVFRRLLADRRDHAARASPEQKVTERTAHLAGFERRLDESDRAILENEDLVPGVFRDAGEREQRSRARLEQEQRHHHTLVREAHHRINNNLQGIVGLLREHATAHPEIADVIGSAIGQVQSISVVHGLRGQDADLQVQLCDMVVAIARNASTLTRAAVQPEVQLNVDRPVRVDSDEAVPIVLIINELLQNAVKHGSGGPGEAAVVVRLIQTGYIAVVSVMNAGTLPQGFDFGRGQGSGTGLGLVRSLLPRRGAELQLEQTSEGVCARLTLGPPVISV